MGKLRKLLTSQRGAAGAVIAVMLPVMLGFAALTVDMGNIYVTRAQLSSAADAAALAGAQELPRFPSDAVVKAKDYGARNGLTTVPTVELSGNNYVIKVTASRNVPLTFAGALGLDTFAVAASATAQVSVANSVPWIVPFVLPKTQYFDYTKQFTMRMYGKDNPYFNASREDAILQMDYMNVGIENTVFDQYIYYLKYGYQKTFTVGNYMKYLAPSSGGQASVDAFYDRTVRDTNTDITKAKIGDPRIMLIPLVDAMLPRTTAEGTSMKIVGFVGFFLDEVHREYSTKFWAKGRFIKDLNVGAGDSTNNSAYDFGVRTTKLVQ